MSMYEQYYADKENAKKQFDFYGYAPPSLFRLRVDGYWTEPLGDFRTVERYKEYQEAGMNILFTQTSCTYAGEEWGTSDLKMVMDRAYEAGVRRIILLDERIRLLSCQQDGLVGEGKEFPTQEALDKTIAEYMQPYKDHPAFYGVQFRDEPKCLCFKAMGELTKAIRKVAPNAALQCCLLPLIVLTMTNAWYPDSEDSGDIFDRFEAYLKAFIEETGINSITYDNYPILPDVGNGTVFYRFYFRGMQIAAKVCKETGAKFCFVAQTEAYLVNGKQAHRLPSEDEMFFQMNALLGFGVKQIAYYTYWDKSDCNMLGEGHPEGTAMVSRKGEKMPLYYSVQKINAMAQKLAPVILNFDYVADRYVIKTPFKTHPFHLEYTKRGKLTKIVASSTSQEVALINELYDKDKGQWLYRVQNITYNYYAEQQNLSEQKTTVKFASEFTKVDVFDGMEWKTVELVNGEYTCSLRAGYAEYLLPY